jgi:hypothetical protein
MAKRRRVKDVEGQLKLDLDFHPQKSLEKLSELEFCEYILKFKYRQLLSLSLYLFRAFKIEKERPPWD